MLAISARTCCPVSSGMAKLLGRGTLLCFRLPHSFSGRVGAGQGVNRNQRQRDVVAAALGGVMVQPARDRRGNPGQPEFPDSLSQAEGELVRFLIVGKCVDQSVGGQKERSSPGPFKNGGVPEVRHVGGTK